MLRKSLSLASQPETHAGPRRDLTHIEETSLQEARDGAARDSNRAKHSQCDSRVAQIIGSSSNEMDGLLSQVSPVRLNGYGKPTLSL